MGILTWPLRLFSKCRKSTNMIYLNVAEKNDAAKNIASILSHGTSTRREGLSQYKKIYEFNIDVFWGPSKMVMTSVSGHLLNYEFAPSFKNWRNCNPMALFDAPIIKHCSSDYQKIKRTLEREILHCQGLIIWTDCDREGENIGFEIIKVCTDVKPNINIYRAKFSEITTVSIFRALNSLGPPNKNISDAVDVRQELDLRTGAAFTRLQTLRLQKVFPQKLADKLISYGSCQFPTLGFVVERYQAIEDFISEPFWRIKMNHVLKDMTTEFSWKRDRFFDKNSCEAILDICRINPTATVESIESKEKNKWRPLPLDTVEMEKNVSKKLKINAKDAMKIAEHLYTQGYISYPRTETNIFPKELNLVALVNQQIGDNKWGTFAQRIINEGGPTPRQGNKSDKAHPPIHPTKYAANLTGNEQRLYEYIVRHFLASVHKDARGFETTVNVDVAGEKFTAKGLIILERNYLEVYIYEKWNSKEINHYEQGDIFTPTLLEMIQSATSPPKLLTEADLITLMEKHGIGTDATHAEHIDKIKSRDYVGLHENTYFVPGTLGMGLVEGYNNIGLDVSLAKPTLRAEFETDLKLICEGLKNADEVRREQIYKYKAVFRTVFEKISQIDNSLAKRLSERPNEHNEGFIQNEDNLKPVLKCPKCGSDMLVRSKKNGAGKYLSCINYPHCKNSIWFPTSVANMEVLNEHCHVCGPNVKLVKLTLKQNLFPGDPNPNILCIGGCDSNVLQTLNINISSVKPANEDTLQNISHNGTVFDNNSRNAVDTSRNISCNSQNKNILPKSQNAVNTTTFDNSSIHCAPGTSAITTDDNNIQPNNQENDIVCSCNNKAVLLTVRKDGPNKGRQFYKCANGSCNFFLWAPDVGINQNSNSDQQSNEILCKCHRPVILRTVSKAGPNMGKQFYSCSKPIGDSCNFFKWADQIHGNNQNDEDGNNGGRRINSQANWGNKSMKRSGKSNFSGSTSKTKRKCGICGQEGHTRNKCPRS